MRATVGRTASLLFLVTHTCSHTHIHAVTHTYMQSHIHTCSHTHTHTCSHTHIHAVTNTCMQSHTHTHTCMQSHTYMQSHTHSCCHTHRTSRLVTNPVSAGSVSCAYMLQSVVSMRCPSWQQVSSSSHLK